MNTYFGKLISMELKNTLRDAAYDIILFGTRTNYHCTRDNYLETIARQRKSRAVATFRKNTSGLVVLTVLLDHKQITRMHILIS